MHVIDAEVLAPGRPGIIDVIARSASRVVHVPFGLRAAEEEARFLGDGEDPVVGLFEDDDGIAIAFDATRDAEVAALLLRVVAGREVEPSLVRQVREDPASVTLAMEDRVAFTVFNEVVDGPRPDLEVLLALDRAGFNHLAAPLAVWRRAGRDLGIVQEYLAGASSGYALALTSVRDLYASGGPPELAGGDFGAEAHRLGTMTARMHLGLDQAFGRRVGDASEWAHDIEDTLRAFAPDQVERPEVDELLGQLRSLQVPCQTIRTHGDFHLGRTVRTEQGWYVSDFRPGGHSIAGSGRATVDADGPVFRSPLADVADMMWSFGHVANLAAAERDPTGREGLDELAEAWEARNRRAFLAGYLGVPGISGLVPPGREALRIVTASFELVRAEVELARQTAS
jgi:maltokinase